MAISSAALQMQLLLILYRIPEGYRYIRKCCVRVQVSKKGRVSICSYKSVNFGLLHQRLMKHIKIRNLKPLLAAIFQYEVTCQKPMVRVIFGVWNAFAVFLLSWKPRKKSSILKLVRNLFYYIFYKILH